MKRLRFLTIATCFASALALSSPAHADESPEAQTLFDEAKQLILQGRWAEACPKLARSNQLEPRGTTLFRLAECYENTGKRASAWNGYLGAAAAAQAAGEGKRADFARERAKKLEATLPFLIIAVNQRPVVIHRDGELVDESLLGRKTAVDPGEHVIVADAPGKQRYTSSVFVVDAATTVVTIPNLLDAPTGGAPVTTAPPVSTASHSDATPAHGGLRAGETQPVHGSGGSSKGLRKWALILGGAGVVSAGTGGILMATSGSSSECRGACAAGTGLLIGGALLGVTGLAFFLASTGDGSTATSSSVSVVRSPLEFKF